MKVNRVNLLNAKGSTGAAFLPFSSSIQNAQNVREFSKSASMGVTSLGMSQVQKGMGTSLVLSFMGRNAKQVVHIVPEDGIMQKGGGVGTVISDWIKKFPTFDKDVEHIFVMPYYGGKPIVDEFGVDAKTLTDPDGNPLFKDRRGNLHPVKEIMSYDITRNNSDANESEEIECKMFDASDVLSEDMFKEFVPVAGKKPKLLLVQTPQISSIGGPYAKSPIGYLGGHMFEHYAEFTKASIEGMTRLMKADGFKDFDPRNIVIHDWHSSSALKYIKDKANEGDNLFKEMNIGYIFHNAGRGGYQGVEAGPFAVFKAFATSKQFKDVVTSKRYRDLFTGENQGTYEEKKEFWKTLMPGLADGYGDINPSMLPLMLGAKGYLKLATVSPGYAKECATNPEFASGLTDAMGELNKAETLKGITNGLAAPNRDSQISYSDSPLYNKSYLERQNLHIKYSDGKEIEPMLTFDPDNLDVNEIAEVKKANKFNFLERILRYKEIDPNTLPDGLKGENIVTGFMDKGKSANIRSNLNQGTLDNVKNDNARLFLSWGRGDFQKGLDELLMGIEKYVTSGKDDGKSIFVVCAGIPNNREGEKIAGLVRKLKDMPELQGRFAYIDGWGPASGMASACDFGIFSSRFEPCGLTPQETYARGGAVIGTNTGGMKSTIIPYNGSNIDKATGFRTEKGFYDIARPAGCGDDELRKLRDEQMADEIAKQIANASKLTKEQLDQMHYNAANLKADWDNNDAINDGENSAFASYKHHFFQDFGDGATPEAPKVDIIDNEFIERLAS